MSALPSLLYLDPAEILERLESSGCAGCALHGVEKVFAVEIDTCSAGQRAGRRCHLYRTEDSNPDPQR